MFSYYIINYFKNLGFSRFLTCNSHRSTHIPHLLHVHLFNTLANMITLFAMNKTAALLALFNVLSYLNPKNQCRKCFKKYADLANHIF